MKSSAENPLLTKKQNYAVHTEKFYSLQELIFGHEVNKTTQHRNERLRAKIRKPRR